MSHWVIECGYIQACTEFWGENKFWKSGKQSHWPHWHLANACWELCPNCILLLQAHPRCMSLVSEIKKEITDLPNESKSSSTSRSISSNGDAGGLKTPSASVSVDCWVSISSGWVSVNLWRRTGPQNVIPSNANKSAAGVGSSEWNSPAN